MAQDMNICSFIGRATKDAVISYSNTNMCLAKFSIAVNGWKKDEKASFFNCVMFGKLAENVGQYVTKGKQLAITTEAKQNVWDDSEGKTHYDINFVVNKLQLLGSSQTNASKETEQAFKAEPKDFEDDIPF